VNEEQNRQGTERVEMINYIFTVERFKWNNSVQGLTRSIVQHRLILVT